MPIPSRSALPALMLAAILAAPAAAQERPRTIVVTGQGEVSAAPDMADIRAGVVTQDATADAALDADSAAMTKVMAALKRAGIVAADIQTSNFSVAPQYAPDRDTTGPRRITGYQVSNQVHVRVRDLTKLGTTLDALVRSGANHLGGIMFSIADPKPLAAQARREAVADAAAKAKTLADAAGVSLGPVLEIQESGGGAPRPIAFAAVRAESVPVAPGQTTVSVNVTLTYAIE